MKRYLLTSKGVLHVVEIDEQGKMRSLEQDNIDGTEGHRILRLGEEPSDVHRCENCFGVGAPAVDSGEGGE